MIERASFPRPRMRLVIPVPPFGRIRRLAEQITGLKRFDVGITEADIKQSKMAPSLHA